MAPQVWRGRAPLMRIALTILLCVSFFLQHAIAQSQIQLGYSQTERKIKTRVDPEYPELALKARMSGVARVELTVTPEGVVREVRELGGNPVLLGALVRAVKQWKYEPGPKESVMEVRASFAR